MTTSQEAREYPPLPEPDGYAVLTPNGSRIVPPQEARGYKNAYAFYTADQMRSYVDADRKARQQEALDARLYQWLRDNTHPDNMRKLFNGCPIDHAAIAKGRVEPWLT